MVAPCHQMVRTYRTATDKEMAVFCCLRLVAIQECENIMSMLTLIARIGHSVAPSKSDWNIYVVIDLC